MISERTSKSGTQVTYKYKPVKGVPRPAWTYRAARRNKAIRPPPWEKSVIWNGVATTYYRKPPVRENKRDRTND